MTDRPTVIAARNVWKLFGPDPRKYLASMPEGRTYEDIRARDLPMLCHATATGAEACVFYEPAAGAAGHFFDREAEST